MNKLKIFILLFFFSANGFSQPYFSKMFDLFHMWESAYGVISYNKNQITLTGSCINFGVTDSTQYRRAYTWTLDSMLNPTIKTIFSKTGTYYLRILVLQNTSSKIGILGRGNSTSDTLRYQIVYINNNGDTIKTYEVESSVKFNPTTVILYHSYIYMFGLDITNAPYPMSVICLDTSGKKQWYKIYSSKRCFAISLANDNNGNFLIGGGLYKGNGTTDTLFGWYAKMDTAGNFIWEKTQSDTTLLLGGNPLLIKNSYYWISSRSDQGKITYAYIFKTDYYGNVTWQKIILYGHLNTNGYMSCDMSTAFVKDDNIFGVGTFTDTAGYTPCTQSIQFIKIDTLGNIKWRRLFKQWYKDNRPYSLTPVSDGFIICADGKDSTHTKLDSDAWIIKTDTNGCVVPGCNLHDGIIQIINPEAFVKVYPNPATNELNIEITDERAKPKNFLMYDTKGEMVNMFPVSSIMLKNGIYSFPLGEGRDGAFYLVIELEDGSQAVKKILIQK